MLGASITNDLSTAAQETQRNADDTGAGLLTPGSFQSPQAAAQPPPAARGSIDKQALKVAMIQLLEDDNFMSLIHKRYTDLIQQVQTR